VTQPPRENHVERLLSLESEHGEDLFARGFFISQAPPLYRPSAWVVGPPFRGFQVHHDPRVPLHVVGDEFASLALLGEAFHLLRPSASGAEAARSLLSKLRQSSDALLSETDDLHGRFLIIYQREGGSPRLMNDATGMRVVFHNDGGTCLASHASLLAVNVGNPELKRSDVRAKYGFPGRRTAYEGISVLIPNHTLALNNGALERFYPRSALPPMTSSEAAEAALPYLQSSVAAIVHRFSRTATSLTAGLDSRVTLAASRGLAGEIRYFTYYRPDVENDVVDTVIASRLAARFTLKHDVLDLGTTQTESTPKSFNELLRELTYYRHNPRAAYQYSQVLGPTVDAHMRSNVSEIGRAFYLKTHQIEGHLDSPVDLAATYLAEAVRNTTDASKRRIESDFRDFYDAGRFGDIAGLRDSRDMLYWEHRMASWHGLVVLESDPAFDSFSIFNSRRVLDVLLSPSLPERERGEHLRILIQRSWPELLSEPFNPRATSLGVGYGRETSLPNTRGLVGDSHLEKAIAELTQRAERAEANFRRLRNRRSVRIALRLADLTKPFRKS